MQLNSLETKLYILKFNTYVTIITSERIRFLHSSGFINSLFILLLGI